MNQTRHSQNQSTDTETIGMRFARFAQGVAFVAGQPITFLLACGIVVLWIVTGPIFNYSDTWQLVINTGTTIVTFLMVFLIQNTQNRDMKAVQLKLSELVLAVQGAENKFAAIEDLSDEELEKLHQQCRAQAEETGEHLESRRAERKSASNGRKPQASARRPPTRN